MRHAGTCVLSGPASRVRTYWASPKRNATPQLPPNRQALVDRVRREIAAGDYDTPEKFDLALQRLLDRLI